MRTYRLKKCDILGKHDFLIDVKNSELACMRCLPPKAMKDHKQLFGVLIHERIDVPSGRIYFVEEMK